MAEPSPRRVEELFDRAIDLDPARRAAFLDEQCGADADLRAAVEELLQLDSSAQAADSLLRSPLARTRPQAFAPAARLPPTIGRYRVVRVLGEGGMGTLARPVKRATIAGGFGPEESRVAAVRGKARWPAPI